MNGMVEHAAPTRAATPGTYPYIELQERSTRDGGEAMSLRFLGRCALTGLLALLLAVVAFSQSYSSPKRCALHKRIFFYMA